MTEASPRLIELARRIAAHQAVADMHRLLSAIAIGRALLHDEDGRKAVALGAYGELAELAAVDEETIRAGVVIASGYSREELGQLLKLARPPSPATAATAFTSGTVAHVLNGVVR